MQVSNFRHKNLVRSAFAFDGSNETLTRIDYSDVPEAPKVDKAAFVEDGRVEELNGTILHFRLDSLEIQQNDEDEPLMVARISWYLENTSTYETFSYHASVNARQGTETLDQDYLYGDDSGFDSQSPSGMCWPPLSTLMSWMMSGTSVKLTIEGDDTVLFGEGFRTQQWHCGVVDAASISTRSLIPAPHKRHQRPSSEINPDDGPSMSFMHLTCDYAITASADTSSVRTA